ncbi:DMT family transporter [Arthrobacter sp. ZGTC131]|uniref:EamA family transporter n=1 Tax=Arthrobacter sp. ZGTC131 TaxID=2058898 RepID=UPI000CE4679F|nr:EamA family transporter [Arthrobacter sp. ZGTC131]
MEAYAEHGFGRDDRQTTQPKSRILGGLLTMTGSGVSSQIGAGIGAHAFPTLGPAGVVAVRQLVAAAVLLPAARPPLHRLTWKQWWPALLLGGTIAVMNICLYVAIQRIGLGLAVTLEFLGPLAIALMRSRSKLDVLCAVSAGVGVYVLVLPGPSSDYLGIGIAAVGAACWGAYILLNRVVGQRLPGLQGPAVATLVSMVFYLPVAGYLLSEGSLAGPALLFSVIAGVLCSVIPYAADLVALRHVRPAFFGVYMSINPLLAALSGMVVLGQILAMHEWLGIVLIVATNAAAILLAGHNRRQVRGRGRP